MSADLFFLYGNGNSYDKKCRLNRRVNKSVSMSRKFAWDLEDLGYPLYKPFYVTSRVKRDMLRVCADELDRKTLMLFFGKATKKSHLRFEINP